MSKTDIKGFSVAADMHNQEVVLRHQLAVALAPEVLKAMGPQTIEMTVANIGTFLWAIVDSIMTARIKK